ncbi:MAG: response regulator [Candidatus Omnitrophica bacterium]|nr:response regulator [Candidatus Omnitrophota bacterium]
MPKLLVIDDEPAILDMIKGHFEVRGYKVVTAGDGSEGLEAVKSEKPDLILLDLKMKKMDGDEFIRRAREEGVKTKIVVITGFQEGNLVKRVEQMGVDGILEKPASIVELQRMVERLIKE